MTKIATYENYFDCIFCVSSKIKDKFNEVYKIESSKLLFKETSVEFEEDYERKYEDKECINIGYAARLFIKQKRADLLKEVITLLEKNSINYFLDIAGEGDYRENLEKFVHENNLMKKVRVRGFVKKSQMPDFWKNQDIYINVSEYEGTSQAMLEAMSYCVVPIVTNVSGVDDFIKNGVNGFSCDIGDIDTLIEKITYLSNNRQKLYDMGQNARKVIIDKCRLSDYIMFFVNNLK